jgi:hypothetical protein
MVPQAKKNTYRSLGKARNSKRQNKKHDLLTKSATTHGKKGTR